MNKNQFKLKKFYTWFNDFLQFCKEENIIMRHQGISLWEKSYGNISDDFKKILSKISLIILLLIASLTIQAQTECWIKLYEISEENVTIISSIEADDSNGILDVKILNPEIFDMKACAPVSWVASKTNCWEHWDILTELVQTVVLSSPNWKQLAVNFGCKETKPKQNY